jgi:toxin ParE1/3/4
MAFQIVWTEPAVADLEDIIRYVADQDAVAAEKLRQLLISSVEVLTLFPLIGPVFEKDRTGQTREIVCRGYRIFYQVNEPVERVEILTVRHGRRQDPGHLTK